MKKAAGILLLLTLIFCQGTTFAQLSKRDSLLQLLPAVKPDTNAVLVYIDLGQQYQFAEEFDAAVHYYLQAQSLSRQLNYLHGLYYASDYYAGILYFKGQYDAGIAVVS
jgi:tetratricopeptide (TPR) repeat protein